MGQGLSRAVRWARSPLLALAGLLLIAATPTKTVMPEQAMPILGREVYGKTGDVVGRVVDVLVDAAGVPQAVVLDVGGFLGVGDRVIAVHWSALRFQPADHDHPITIDMPADEIKAAPQYTDTTAPAQVVVPPHPATPSTAAASEAHKAPTPAAPAPAAPPAAATPAPPAAPAQGGEKAAPGAKSN